MKKMTIVALAAMLSASMAFAGMGVSWSAGGWMVTHDGDIDEGPGGAELNAVYWQFIYAGANNAIDDVDLTGTDYLSGDDKLLASRLIPVIGSEEGATGTASDGTEWDAWVSPYDGSTVFQDLAWTKTEEGEYSGKYVYQRLFEGETPAAGMYYFETDVFEFNAAFAEGSAPDEFNYDVNGEGVRFDKQLPSTPEIPEPATMSLLGLGALAMVIRRKLRK